MSASQIGASLTDGWWADMEVKVQKKRGRKPVVLPDLGCGVADHDSTCLCDVIVKEPTPIGVADAVDEMWMGRQLCEIRGYGSPWTGESLADYFTDLCRFYDEWHGLNHTARDRGNPARKRMTQLAVDGVMPAVAVAMVYQEYGVQYTRAAASQAKIRYFKKNGNVPYDPALD